MSIAVDSGGFTQWLVTLWGRSCTNGFRYSRNDNAQVIFCTFTPSSSQGEANRGTFFTLDASFWRDRADFFFKSCRVFPSERMEGLARNSLRGQGVKCWVSDRGFKDFKCSQLKSNKENIKYKIKLAACLLNMRKSKNWESGIYNIYLFSALKMF